MNPVAQKGIASSHYDSSQRILTMIKPFGGFNACIGGYRGEGELLDIKVSVTDTENARDCDFRISLIEKGASRNVYSLDGGVALFPDMRRANYYLMISKDMRILQTIDLDLLREE